MALHLNLFHEIHKQAERERRDPVKLAVLAGLAVVVLLVVWYFLRLSTVSGIERTRNGLRATWATLEPQMKAAAENEPKLVARQKSNEALIQRIQGRFYWASFLEKFASLTPPPIQVVSLVGDLEEKQPRTVSVLVKGVAAGMQPRTVAEDYRRSLQEGLSKRYGPVAAVFDANSLEDGVDTAVLNGQTLPTATFRIRINLTAEAK